jgi:hypothetical protein
MRPESITYSTKTKTVIVTKENYGVKIERDNIEEK